MKIRVVLTDSEKFAQHASGYVDADKVLNTNCVERNKRLYIFNSFCGNTAFFIEANKLPYIITEW